MRRLNLGVLLLFALANPAFCRSSANDDPIVLRDAFGRDLKERGVLLLDWEGYMANPAARLRLELHPRVNLPARVILRADGPRLMFNLFSEVGPDGPAKTLLFENGSRVQSYLMAVFPDRDGEDEEYRLTAELTTGVGEKRVQGWRVRVKDLDREVPPRFTVVVDCSQDRTGFFQDAKARRILEQAVADWSYFLDDQGFAPVDAGDEVIYVHDPETFERGWTVRNTQPYTGFLLFAQGIRGPEKRSGGRASHTGRLQVRDGRATGLRRSGTVISEVTGNWNGLGWSMEESDDRWYVSSCHAREPHDYYSVVRHEIGHSLLYHRVHPAFARITRTGRLRYAPLARYLGGAPRVNASEHLYETVDPVSRVGAFGNEYGGDMPRKRWLITKVDLLALQAVGYRVRPVTALQALETPRTCAWECRPGDTVEFSLPISGGVEPYLVRLKSGPLPDGVALDSFTGALRGTPRASGRGTALLEVRDSDPTSRPRLVRILWTVRSDGSGRQAQAPRAPR